MNSTDRAFNQLKLWGFIHIVLSVCMASAVPADTLIQITPFMMLGSSAVATAALCCAVPADWV
jgi:hypothetical protein